MDNVTSVLQSHGLRRKEQITALFQSKNISGKVLKKAEDSESKEGGDHWITINHRHLLIGGGGEVKQGGKGMADGKDIEKVGKDKKGDKGEGLEISGFDQSTKTLKVKNPKTGEERTLSPEEHAGYVKKNKLGGKHSYKPTEKDKQEAEEYNKNKGRETKQVESQDKKEKEHFNKNASEEKRDRPSDEELRATEFEGEYSKKEAKKYAEGGIPKSKKKRGRPIIRSGEQARREQLYRRYKGR